MKRLFGIKKPNGDWYEVVPVSAEERKAIKSLATVFYVEKKTDAKRVRDALNSKLPECHVDAYTVALGPDHRNYKK